MAGILVPHGLAEAGGVEVVDCKRTMNGKCVENQTVIGVDSFILPSYTQVCAAIGTDCAPPAP